VDEIMARSITTLAEARVYLQGLYRNAGHHAQEMFEVYPKVYVAAAAHMDDDSPLQVRESKGRTANEAWVWFNGQRFSFSYDHNGGVIVREQSNRGRLVARFDRSSTFEDIYRFFEQLAARVAPRST
jgi:hypothetical protein